MNVLSLRSGCPGMKCRATHLGTFKRIYGKDWNGDWDGVCASPTTRGSDVSFQFCSPLMYLQAAGRKWTRLPQALVVETSKSTASDSPSLVGQATPSNPSKRVILTKKQTFEYINLWGEWHYQSNHHALLPGPITIGLYHNAKCIQYIIKRLHSLSQS